MNLAGINLFTERTKVHVQEMHRSLPPHPPRDLKPPAEPSHVKPRLSRDAADIAGMSGSEAGRCTWAMYANAGF